MLLTTTGECSDRAPILRPDIRNKNQNMTEPESDLSGAWDSFGKLLVGAVTLALAVMLPFAARRIWPFLVVGIILLVLGRLCGDRIFRRGVFSFLGALDGVEMLVYAVAGIVVFVWLNLLVWRWVASQDSAALTTGYVVLVVAVVGFIGRDLWRRRIGWVSAIFLVIYLGCVVWAGLAV